ncbi:aspartate kinase [Rickettsiaceae bacterium]|nr:aspartate kinase [Rickettsiaceae bacterium]
MGIVVQKFGGTSVADLDRVRHVANIVKAEMESGNKVIAVVSAMSGVTNSLISKCNEISKLENDTQMREYDAAIASGEIVTSALLALALQDLGIKAKSMQGWQVPIKTDGNHGNAQIYKVGTKMLHELLDNGVVPVVTGFQGSTNLGDVTTLGKGGSDTSAAVIAGEMEAERCDIYTDVDGIYSADPRVVHNARKIDEINIDELCTLCQNGAKVLHPGAALAAREYGLQMRVLSSFSGQEGTLVSHLSDSLLQEGKPRIAAITSNKNLLKLVLYCAKKEYIETIDFLAKSSIEIYSSSEIDTGFLLAISNLSDKNKLKKLLDRLKSRSIIKKYELSAEISSVTIVGYGIYGNSSLISKVTQELTSNSVEMLSSQISDTRISLLINDRDNEKTIKLLHNKLL